MRNKIVDDRDCIEAGGSITLVIEAIKYRKTVLDSVSASLASFSCHVNLTKPLRQLFSAEARSR